MPEPTITTHTVRRAAFTTPKSFENVVEALRVAAGRPNDTYSLWSPEGADAASVTRNIKSREGPSGFFMFVERPVSRTFALFAPEGAFHPKVTQFVVGDPITAAKIYQVTPRVALLAPLRLAIIELPEGRGTEIVYDIPTSIIGGESKAAGTIAESVDVKVERYIRSVL
ncbi:hypothetical protein K439DRAFT_1630258 [Ramaria rubella]|nr:hypothetical protein K439DRAFT_1630258 [Ramaria rubella]